ENSRMKHHRLRKELPFTEGTWFAVPLQNGGCGIGRIARHTVEGYVLLAYFFGPKKVNVPTPGVTAGMPFGPCPLPPAHFPSGLLTPRRVFDTLTQSCARMRRYNMGAPQAGRLDDNEEDTLGGL